MSDRAAKDLSAGQRRRLGLARLLVTGRALWLLDEPTVSLDAANVRLFEAVVAAHLRKAARRWFPAICRSPARMTTWISRLSALLCAGDQLVTRLFWRDIQLATRAGGGFGLALVFFLIIVTFVPFSIGPEPELLARIAPGILWLGALLSCLLSLDRLFALDFEDGTLDLLATAPLPLEAVAAMKSLAHWATTGLPLTLAAPV